jgi:hypothetical protein
VWIEAQQVAPLEIRDASLSYKTTNMPHADGGWLVNELWDAKSTQEACLASALGPALGTAGPSAPADVIETNTVSTDHAP